MSFLTPSEIAGFTVNAGIRKANLSASKQFLLGIMAGAFIAFGAQASSMATHTITDVAIAKLIAGLIFPAGLMLVLMAGAELFTGNSLMVIALCERKITLSQLLRSWLVVYAGNFAGSLIVACLILWSGQWDYTGGLLGASTIKAAAGKISLSFGPAVVLQHYCVPGSVDVIRSV